MNKIKGFPGYEVSRTGEIYSHKTGKYLVGGTDGDGYRRYCLMREDGKQVTLKGHRMVANLEWVTSSENALHAAAKGNMSRDTPSGEDNWNAVLTEDSIRQIRAMHGVVSQYEVAKQFGVNQSVVSRVQNFKIWKHVV